MADLRLRIESPHLTSYNVITNRNGISLWLSFQFKYISLCIQNESQEDGSSTPPSPLTCITVVGVWVSLYFPGYQVDDIVEFFFNFFIFKHFAKLLTKIYNTLHNLHYSHYLQHSTILYYVFFYFCTHRTRKKKKTTYHLLHLYLGYM